MAQSAESIKLTIVPKVEAGRAAISPLSDRALLNDYYRKLIIPNIDEKRNIYVGIIMKILEQKDEDYKVKDIFYDAISNQERITNIPTNNENKKILFVHVPFFTTSNRIETTSFLNYDTFNKVRIIYEGKDPVQVGNLIKFQFTDKSNYSQPVVSQIVTTDIKFTDTPSDVSTQTFQESTAPFLSISTPKQDKNTKQQELTKPVGGFTVAFEKIQNILDSKYILNFISLLDSNVYGDLSKINISLIEVLASTKILGYATEVKIPQRPNTTGKDYLIYVKINFSCEKKDQIQNLIKEYTNYVTENLFSSKKYSFKKEDGQDNLFSLDVNFNDLINISEKKLSTYLQVQKDFVDTKNYIINSKAKKIVVPNIIENNFVMFA